MNDRATDEKQYATAGQPNPDYEPMLQFFEPTRGTPDSVSTSMNFEKMAECIVRMIPRNPERTVALRKLLESRDCALRALVMRCLMVGMFLCMTAATHAEGISTIGTVRSSEMSITIHTGKTFVIIRPDGKVEFGDGYNPDEAARAFWTAVSRNVPRCGP